MGLGFLCCCRKPRMRPSFQDPADMSPTRHHSQQHASQIKSVGALAVLSSSEQEPQGRDSGPRHPSQEPQEPDSGSSSHSMRRFSFSKLEQATNNFNKDWVMGSGGFGQVFKAELNDGTKIAVKRRDPNSNQGRKEFDAEIEVCSGLHHRHVVSLLGFCDERDEMMLVYEYMGQGNLASHLYGSRSSNSNLTWEERLKILIEAASGLHYLHTCSEKRIIHRDVKSSNILLDDDLVAKIADFGLSKVGPELGKTHVTTEVKGTHGFMDADYFYSKHLTPESDVYAFGVVLLEALCARKAVDHQLPEDEVVLATWAKKQLKDKGHLQDIVDRRMSDAIRPNSLKKFAKTVKKCLASKHKLRPSMENIVSELSVVLQLQTGRVSLPEDDDGDSPTPPSSPCSPPVPMSDCSEDDSSDDSSQRLSSRPGSRWKVRSSRRLSSRPGSLWKVRPVGDSMPISPPSSPSTEPSRSRSRGPVTTAD